MNKRALQKAAPAPAPAHPTLTQLWPWPLQVFTFSSSCLDCGERVIPPGLESLVRCQVRIPG